MTNTATLPAYLDLPERRWHPLRPHPEQSRLFHYPTRFKIVPAGRRSGKTEVAKRKLVLSLLHTHPDWLSLSWPDPRFFAAAPTRDQAKRIWWKDLKAMVPAEAVGTISETDLCITTYWGAELWVVGLDKPQRIEGSSWDGGVIDELADCKPGTWDAHIRPALSDRKGWCWLIGVPDMEAPGQVEYKALYERAKTGQDPEWAAYHWPSRDILDADEIAAAERQMDPDLFEQEYGGVFKLAGGLAFPTFDYKTHVRELSYDPALPLAWSLDFNVNPMASGIIQHIPRTGEVRVLHEFALSDSSTDVACDAFLDFAQEHGWNAQGVAIYGDSTGNARDSTSGTTDWKIVLNRLKNLGPVLKVPREAPERKDTVNAVRAKLRSADGQAHLFIDPSCRLLIKNFGEALWPSDLEPWHALAWLRYFVEREYPVRTVRKETEQRFSV